MSVLTVNVGSMFSGKSTLLINQGERHVRAGHRVIYLKPDMDNRYSETEIVTHSGLKVKALAVKTHSNVIKCFNPDDYDVILIDEIQFFAGRVIQSIKELLELGKKVYCSGLDMDFLGDAFQTTETLLAIADQVNKLKAVCECCGCDAGMTGKRNMGEPWTPIVELGAKEKYIPLCRKCFYEYRKSIGGNWCESNS